jgi:hypothetical protein
MVEEDAAYRQGIAGVLRRHPVLAAVFVGCTLLGVTLGVLYLPADWALARKIAGGAFAGVGVAVFLTVTRLFD